MNNNNNKVNIFVSMIILAVFLVLGVVAIHNLTSGNISAGAVSMVSPESSTQALYGVESIGTGGTLYFGGTTNNPNYNGSSVKITFPRQALATATTTVCAIVTPSATSTVENLSAYFSTGTTSAATVRAYISATPYANTTFLGGINLAANTGGTFLSTTTSDSLLIGPSQYIVITEKATASTNTGTVSPLGFCQAQFTTLI